MTQDIFIGDAPNDKTGTPARSAGQMINANFAYLDAKISNSNHVVTMGTSVLVGQNLTIHAGWVWQINGNNYENPADVVINFPLCATGNQRLDRIVFNTSSTFTKLSGVESVSNPVATPVPVDTIEFGITLVTDGSVGEPSVPIEGDVYVKKMESQDFIVNYGATTVIEQINLTDDRSSVSLTNAVTDIKSIQQSGEFLRPGKPHFVKNRSGHNVTIWHNAGTGNVKYFFPNASNFIIKPNEVIEFNLNGNDSSDYQFEFVGVITDLSNYYNKSEIDTKLSSVLVYKGSVANYAALPSSGLTIGDVYNLSDTGHNYAWTGTVWDDLGPAVDISGKEDSVNKVTTMTGNTTSNIVFLTAKAVYDWGIGKFQDILTDVNFGAFINGLTSKSTPIDADSISIVDSADSNKQKKVSLTNFKVFLKAYFDTLYSPQTFNQSRWQFSDFTNSSANQGPFVGTALASGTLLSSGITSISDLNSLGHIVLNSSVNANSGYRIMDAGGVAMCPRSGITFLGKFGLESSAAGRDRITRIGLHSTQNHVLPVNGVYLEVLGNTASFKSTASSVTTSSSTVNLDDSFTGSSVVLYSVFITFTADRTARCVLYSDTMAALLTITFTTADNMPSFGSRFNSGIITTITTAGAIANICQVDYMGVGIAKPSFLNSY